MQDDMDLFESANATRTRAAAVRKSAAGQKRLLDRLLVLEGAVALDRQAATLEARAAEQSTPSPAGR